MPHAASHELRVLGSRTAYWEYGSAHHQTVVLVHGFRGDHHGLERIAEALSEHYRVLVPDVPGFGESSTVGHRHTLEHLGAWLSEFCELAAPDDFHLVGHSFGSLIASQALALGLTPATLSLINPISAPALEGPRGVLTWFAVQYYRLGAVLPEAIARRLLTSRVIVRVMSESMAKTTDRHLRAWIHDQHDRYFSVFADRESLLESFRASVEHHVPQFMSTFSTPMLVIAGELDDITPLRVQLDLARRVSGSELRVIRGSGHLVHYEAAAEAATSIHEFIGELAR